MIDVVDALDPDEAAWELSAALQELVHSDVVVPVGADDCSVVRLGTELTVISTDYVNASPIGLELGIANHADLGYYLVASNISDLIGTGAEPVGLFTSVMWNRDTPKCYFDELMVGVKEACATLGIAVLGGDTKLTSDRTVLCGTALGRARSEDDLFLQTRARVGQGVWVSGGLGSCAAAVVGLTELHLSDRLARWATEAIRHPVLPLELSRAVAALHLGAGGADISDGLGADLARICRVSGVAAEVDADLIPLEDEVHEIAELLGVVPSKFAFALGGDLQFLVTSDQGEAELQQLGLSRIGEVVTGDSSIVSKSCRYEWPNSGHRDARGVSFAAEVRELVDEMTYS